MNRYILNIGIIGNFDFLPLFLPPPLIRVSERKESIIRLPNENVATLPHLANFPHAKQAIAFAANRERENLMNEWLGFEKESQVESIIRNTNYIANPTKIRNGLTKTTKSQPKLSRKERRKNKRK